MVDATPDETERFLDLAGFADERLEADDRERIAEWLARDPVAAGDIAAARALASSTEHLAPLPEPLAARAEALIADGNARGNVVPFAPLHHLEPRVDGLRYHAAARWGSLAAAVAVAGWLGFTLGMDTSLSFGQSLQLGDSGFLSEFLDPSTGTMGDLTEGRRT